MEYELDRHMTAGIAMGISLPNPESDVDYGPDLRAGLTDTYAVGLDIALDLQCSLRSPQLLDRICQTGYVL